MLDITMIQTSAANSDVVAIIYSLLLAFLLSSAIGYTYIKTYIGLSYSRNFIQALILGSIVTSVIMMAIGDSLTRGLGMIGALSIVRFRTNFRDPKDIVYIFAALVVGIACGVGSFVIALVGTLIFISVGMLLYFASFTSRTYYDGMMRFSVNNDDDTRKNLEKILTKYCKTFALVTVRDIQQRKRLDYAYHIKLKSNKEKESFINELKNNIASLEGLSLMMQENTIEL